MPSDDRERKAAAREVLDFLSDKGLTLDDLVEYGGEDLNSLDSRAREKARLVERAWRMMARLGLSAEDIGEEE